MAVYVVDLGAYLALLGFGGNAALCGNGNVPGSCRVGPNRTVGGEMQHSKRNPLPVDVVVGEWCYGHGDGEVC